MLTMLCKLFGHKSKQYLIDGDGVHLSRCCIIRALICQRCKAWLPEQENGQMVDCYFCGNDATTQNGEIYVRYEDKDEGWGNFPECRRCWDIKRHLPERGKGQL